MIIGVGTDLVKVDRIAAVIARHGDRFINRCFAVEERWGNPKDRCHLGLRRDNTLLAAHYAKRWAAKEAVAKALGLGIDAGVYLRDIVVVKDDRGAPRIELRGGAAGVLTGRDIKIHLSLSDDAGIALAFVVIEV
jgi:holo-[acyl-carrier protein] synthase